MVYKSERDTWVRVRGGAVLEVSRIFWVYVGGREREYTVVLRFERNFKWAFGWMCVLNESQYRAG